MAETGRSLAGRLLVAERALRDPNFERTVVYLIDHSLEDGALGVVLNRPGGLDVRDIVPEWAPYISDPATVFAGGPVTPEGAIGLARCHSAGPAAGSLADALAADALDTGALDAGAGRPPFRPITDTLGILDLHGDPSDAPGGITAIRIFAGYSGWSAGQLEQELEVGGWHVVDAHDDDVFSEQPAQLWRSVLARQRGPLRAAAYFPDDPSVN